MAEQIELSGKHILIVEDEFFICEEMARAFEDVGATVVGPVANVANALDLLSQDDVTVDAAVLDINLNGEMCFPVAEILHLRGTPFLFTTGYDAAVVPEVYANIIRCEKPVDPSAVAAALFGGSRTCS